MKAYTVRVMGPCVLIALVSAPSTSAQPDVECHQQRLADSQNGSLWVPLGANCSGQALGIWKMIPAKSRQSSGPLAQAITVKYEARSKEAHAEAETWAFYEIRTDGTSETTSPTLRFDGKEYPGGDLGLEERPDTVVSTKLDARTAEVSYKKAGRVIRRVVRTVSADGRQMTLEVRILPEKGPAAEHWMVFGR